MDVGAFQPTAKVPSGSVTPQAINGQSSVTSPFGGGPMGAFDILLQQLTQLSGEGEQTNSEGFSFLNAFSEGGFALPFPFLSQSEDGLTIDTEQLTAFFSQFQSGGDSENPLPTLLQEIQTLLENASDASQAQIDLSALLSNATQQQKAELVGFFQSQNVNFSGVTLESLRSALEQQTNQPLNSAATTGQQTSTTTVTDGQNPNVPLQDGSQAAKQEGIVTQVDPQLNLKAPRADELLTATRQRTPVQPNNQQQPVIPELYLQQAQDYLTPEYLAKPEVKDALSKVGGDLLSSVPKATVSSDQPSGRIEQSLLESLSLGESANPTSQSGGGLRSSLNFSTNSQNLNQQSNASTTQTEGSVETSQTRFESNLERLQETQSVIKQVTKSFHLRQGMKTQELSVKLEPQYLGEVTVKVQLKDKGVVNVQMVANHGHVKDLLENNMVALKSSMENSDMKVEDIQVSLSDQSEDFNGKESVGEGLGQKSQKSSHQGPSFDEFVENENGHGANGEPKPSVTSILDRMYSINAIA